MDINIQDLLIFFNSKASTSIAGFLIITISIIAIYSQRKTARQKTSLIRTSKQHLLDIYFSLCRHRKNCVILQVSL
jgi:hypothetical protein